MRINHNIAALNTHRQLSSASIAQSKSMEKLSSGLRINRAGDDAAGLAISEKMRGQIRGLEQANRNSQDAISMIQTAEGASSTVHDALQRARELAVQAANDTLTDIDRQAINEEVTQLKSQIDTVSENTEFNTIKMLNSGSLAGIDSSVINDLKTKIPLWIDDALSQISTNLGIQLPAAVRDMSVKLYSNSSESRAAYMSTSDGGATLELGLNLSKLLDGNKQIPAGTGGGQFDTVIAHEIVHALQFTEMSSVLGGGISDAEMWFVEGLATAVQGGNGFLSSLSSNSAASINTGMPWSGDYASAYAAVKTLHEVTVGGINAFIDRMEAGDTLDQAFANTTQQVQGEFGVGTVPADFNTASDFLNWFNTSSDVDTYLDGSTDFSAGTGAIKAGGTAGSSFGGTQEDTIANDTSVDNTGIYNLSFDEASIAQSEQFTFQIGANTDQSVKMNTFDISSNGLAINSINLTSRHSAEEAIETLDGAIATVSTIRSYYGALQNRLEHTINNLGTSAENLTSAESRIRDVDMASEMMAQTKNSILSQAAQAMLAQANQQTQGVLQLLR